MCYPIVICEWMRGGLTMPVFSVIVPIYNVAVYLPACVGSVLSQTFEDYELILIDDGSTDEGGTLCDELAQRHPWITVYHQPNAGLAAARNAGLDKAQGEYILFLDGDDVWLDAHFLDKIDTIIRSRQPDLVLYNYARFADIPGEPALVRLGPAKIAFSGRLPADANAAMDALAAQNAYQSSACIRAARHELLQNQRFENQVLSEDIEWSAALLVKAASIVWLDEEAYGYRVREGSITKNISLRHVQDLTQIIEKLALWPRRANFPFARREAFLSYLAFQYATLLINMRLCNFVLPKDLSQRIRQLGWLLRHGQSRQVKLVYAAWRLLGLGGASRLLAGWFRLNNRSAASRG